MVKKVTIYTTPNCPYCKFAKEFFKKNKIQYEEIDASQPETAQKLFKKTGQTSVPQIFITDQAGKEHFIMGFDEAKLKKILKI